ncbi:MAG: hypothetical protein JWM34_2724 [Ilumatobacteraceae bacterium]|nr:hypothetical protein [Ilumatobacteraceae bacterium]
MTFSVYIDQPGVMVVRRIVRPLRTAVSLLIAVAVAVAGFAVVPMPSSPAAAAGACAADLGSGGMSDFFASGSSGFVGGDYAHAYPLPDGRTLWMFQDSFIGAPDTASLGDAAFVHNLAMIQTDSCFQILHGGSADAPTSYIGGDLEVPFTHWFWPLGAGVGADGQLDVFMAEFVNAAGTGATAGATPIATWRATVRLSDLAVTSFAPAADPSDRPLYGTSVATSGDWSYLYGNCYRQFTSPGLLSDFDETCTRDVYLARVPAGRFDSAPTYWNGHDWSANRADAVPVHSGGALADPLQVQAMGDGEYLGVSKLDDWWGTSVSMYTSAAPTGPFVRYAVVPVSPRCDPHVCDTYFAAPLPWRSGDGSVELSISGHTWDPSVARAFPTLYRPFVIDAPAPGDPATRVGIADDGTLALQIAGRGGVGADATAATLTVTADRSSGRGYVTVWPCGATRPLASNLNLVPGSAVANLVVSGLSSDGRVCLWSSVETDLIVDVQGWYGPGIGTVPIAPARLLDTRPQPTADGEGSGGGALDPTTTTEVQVAGRGGVDPSARFAALNVTATSSARAGFVTIWPCGPQPATSNLNVAPGSDIANLVVVPLSARGTVCVRSSVPTQLVLDVQAWYSGDSSMAAAGPARLLDTRAQATTVDGRGLPAQTVRSGQIVQVPIAGRVGISSAGAAVVNLTVTNPTSDGYVEAWPCGTAQPLASNLNFTRRQTRAAATITSLAANGMMCLTVGGGGSADVIVDVFAWYPPGTNAYRALVPTRLLDTRSN